MDETLGVSGVRGEQFGHLIKRLLYLRSGLSVFLQENERVHLWERDRQTA